MASALITTRQTKSGPRYVVRFRLGGRSYPLVHGGSFRTMKEALARRDLIAAELALGRNPKIVLEAMRAEPVPTRTFASYASAYVASRVDVAASTASTVGSHMKRILPAFAQRDPAEITPSDVREWIGSLELGPASVRAYLRTLRAVLDFAGLDGPANPARDARMRLPRARPAIVDPPTAAGVATIIATVPARWRLPLRVLEGTGMRVGELAALSWGDVDEHGSRFRIKAGKTAAARRWVAVPEWVMAEVAATVPREDRVPERLVFPGAGSDTLGKAMTRACRTAGIVHRHPHDLRHRFASVKIAEGVPVTVVAAQLGHSRKSLTLDVYSHVLVDIDP
jgi:integrase